MKRANAGLRHGFNATLGLLALAGIFACSTITPAQQLVTACQSADAALRVAIAADKQGKLTDGQRRAITIAGTTVNGFCAAPQPPGSIPAALRAVSAAVADLSTQVH